MKRHPWKAFALVWAIDIAAVVLIEVLFAHAIGGAAEWKGLGVGLAIGLIVSTVLTWDVRQRRDQADKDLLP